MDLIECSNGHYYDKDRFSCCPYCSSGSMITDETTTCDTPLDLSGDDGKFKWDVTDGKNSKKEEIVKDSDSTLSGRITSVKVEDDEEKTVAYYDDLGQPVVGWLVCIEGKHFGKDFKLKSGGNFIGRSTEMDVALTGDSSVSRNKHAVIIYEPKNNIFIMQPGESKGLSYLNDKVVLTPTELKSNDKIQVGNTKLMFIPCCTNKFTWDLEKKEEDK